MAINAAQRREALHEVLAGYGNEVRLNQLITGIGNDDVLDALLGAIGTNFDAELTLILSTLLGESEVRLATGEAEVADAEAAVVARTVT